MEKLNFYAPYILVSLGIFIAIFSFLGYSSNFKGYFGLIFIVVGLGTLYMRSKTK